MRWAAFWVCAVAAGCSGSAADMANETTTADAGAVAQPDAAQVVETEDAEQPQPDAELGTDAGADAAPEPEDSSAPDAPPDVADEPDAGQDAAVPIDSGADTSSPPVDAGADAGPCVDYVSVPTSPLWTIRAHYTLSPTTSQSVPYVCPDGVVGNSCKFALGNPADGKKYPAPGACRIAVPTQCLPCTSGTTQW